MSIKERAKLPIDTLTPDKAKLIVNLIEYLNEKEEWKATKELLKSKYIVEVYREAKSVILG